MAMRSMSSLSVRREMGAGQGGSADEVDLATEPLTEECQKAGDEVVALDLFGRHSELFCDPVASTLSIARYGP
jgi:hypothetical protein